ncbi:hypothetical protein H4Q26_017002 [Puccinia striiformis f. sp. tritici PST-130]|nr:hypothetical protein H4Q26_017002 [Puccinia striiformis f. sp. tritici PST-130]
MRILVFNPRHGDNEMNRAKQRMYGSDSPLIAGSSATDNAPSKGPLFLLIITITSPRAPSKRTPPDSPTATTAYNTNSSIHHMDLNANPYDSQPVTDLPETSPGGARPVEESVEANPTANVERAEEAAAFPPHVEHAEEEEWIDLPEEMNADLAELFYLPRARADQVNLNEPDLNRALRAPNGDANPAITVNIQDLFAHLAATFVSRHDIGFLPLAGALQSVTPEQDRVVLQNFFDAGSHIIVELTNNPQQRVYSLQEIADRLGSFEDVWRIVENLDRDTSGFISIFLHQIIDAIYDLTTTPSRIEIARQEVDTLLDSLTNASISALPSDGTQTDSPSCTICQEHYVESDVTVSLQCHNSHHFHRDCILEWLHTLVPDPFTCPICRAAIELIAPPNPDQLD